MTIKRTTKITNVGYNVCRINTKIDIQCECKGEGERERHTKRKCSYIIVSSVILISVSNMYLLHGCPCILDNAESMTFRIGF